MPITNAQELFLHVLSEIYNAEHMHWHRLADGKLAERWAVRDGLGTLI